MFYKVLESPKIKNYKGITHREAVRGIIISKNNILLVLSNRGDYKFPGGGVEKNESHSEALAREVKEETGYINCVIQDKVGTVMERKIDEFTNGNLFQMTSHYYFCELTNLESQEQQLDEYESILNFSPVWVPIDNAIKQNESLVPQFDDNSWLNREIFSLKEIKKILNGYDPTIGGFV